MQNTQISDKSTQHFNTSTLQKYNKILNKQQMEEKKLSTVKIPDGFTKWDFNIDYHSYKTFAWWGELLVLLDGEQKIVSASGHNSGDSGDMVFKFTGGDFTQEEVNRLEIIAYKTNPEILYKPL